MQDKKISLKAESFTFQQRKFIGKNLVVQLHTVRTGNAPTGKVELWVGTDIRTPLVQARDNVITQENPQGAPVEVIINSNGDNGAQDQILFENPGYAFFELRYVRDAYQDPNPNDNSLTTNFLVPSWSMKN